VQGAIDQAQAGGTIYICPGTYNESLTITKNLTLIGAGSGDGAEDTVLDADSSGRVVAIHRDQLGNPAVVELQNIRITGGDATGEDLPDGGGIYNKGGDLTLETCGVSQNHASRGGGIFTEDGLVTITNSDVQSNSAVGQGGGIHNGFGQVTLNGGSVMLNTAGEGGGIYNDFGIVTLNGTTVDNNFVNDSENNCAPPDSVTGCSD
jgi:hypothetical protein